MIKLSFLLSVVTEWLYGPTVEAVADFGFAAFRTFLYLLIAWMALEAIRLLYVAVADLFEA